MILEKVIFAQSECPMLKIERRKPLHAQVGVLGVGHHTYWAQFAGLLEGLRGKQARFIQRLQSDGLRVSDFGLVDESKSAYAALAQIRQANLDLLFVDMLTYATSAAFAPLVQGLDIPIVLVALQPEMAMDYARGSTFIQLSNDDFCSVPEFASTALRMGKPVPPLILGHEQADPIAEAEIASWCRIARALHDLKSARIGLMGHVLESMYDMHTDPALITREFGCHVVACEADEILHLYRQVSEEDIVAMQARILSFFRTPDPVSDEITFRLKPQDLRSAAKAALALERFAVQKDLSGLAYYYEGEPGSEMRELVTNFAVGNSLLIAAGFPVCGEFDLKTCMGMLIMDRLEMGGSFAEFHPLDFKRGSVLVGHDGPHHLNIAAEKPVLRSLGIFHGKPGSGAGVEFKIQEGPLTMLSVTVNAHGRIKFVIAEGESLQGEIPPTGNTNSHAYFKPDLRTFLRRWIAEGPTHHFALGIGHRAAEIQKLAAVLGIEAVWVESSTF
jgi:L-arabinose isomerase